MDPVSQARKHLDKAKEQLHKAAIHSWEPSEPADCVALVFYAYENAVVAAATVLRRNWKKHHGFKADLAAKLVAEGSLETDVSHLLERLNELRKDIAYGEPGLELAGVDLEDLVSNLESFVQEV